MHRVYTAARSKLEPCPQGHLKGLSGFVSTQQFQGATVVQWVEVSTFDHSDQGEETVWPMRKKAKLPVDSWMWLVTGCSYVIQQSEQDSCPHGRYGWGRVVKEYHFFLWTIRGLNSILVIMGWRIPLLNSAHCSTYMLNTEECICALLYVTYMMTTKTVNYFKLTVTKGWLLLVDPAVSHTWWPITCRL